MVSMSVPQLHCAAEKEQQQPSGSAEGEAHRKELVRRVKAVQKESERKNLLWRYFCHRAGLVQCDPGRQTAEFLEAFLQDLDLGRLEVPEGFASGAPRRRKAEAGAEAAVARPAPQEEVDAARARVAAGSGQEVWELLPPRWRPLYRAQRRLRFDAARYDFLAPVREMLDCPDGLPLSRLHEVQRPPEYEPCPPLRKGMLLAGAALSAEKRIHKSRNRNKKDWTSSPAFRRFLELYVRFVREVVLPLCRPEAADGGGGDDDDNERGEAPVARPDLEEVEAVVQSSPVLRVVMPSRHYATQPHKDADYGHLPEELNFWMPLTPVWGSNSLFVEGFPGRSDFEPFEGDFGHVFRFWGNQCAHYAEANGTGSTRVSLDFRAIPRAFWDAAEQGGGVEAAAARRTFFHEGELAMGHYYRLERTPGPAGDRAGPGGGAEPAS